MAGKVRDELFQSAKSIGQANGYTTVVCPPCNGSATVQLDDELLSAIGMKPGDRCPVCLGYGVLFQDSTSEEPTDAFGLLEIMGVTLVPRPIARSRRPESDQCGAPGAGGRDGRP